MSTNRFEREGVNDYGYKVGDQFKVLVTECFNKGDMVELVNDDGSDCPEFAKLNTFGTACGYEEYRLLEWIGHKDDNGTPYPTETIDKNTTKTLQDVADLIDWNTEVIVKIITKDTFEVKLTDMDKTKSFDNIDEMYDCVKSLVAFFRED